MIYYAGIDYGYEYHLGIFVSTPNETIAPEVLQRAENLFVVDPRALKVLKNNDGAHHFNHDHAMHGDDPAPANPNSQALVVVDEVELIQWLQRRCPRYYEWKWETARECQP